MFGLWINVFGFYIKSSVVFDFLDDNVCLGSECVVMIVNELMLLVIDVYFKFWDFDGGGLIFIDDSVGVI